MYEAVVVEAELRDPGSSNLARRLRRAGKLPAVLYGGERGSRTIAVSPRAIVEILKSEHGENTILNLRVADGREQTVLIHDYQVDPISMTLVHCDFVRISMDVAVEVEVRIEIVGEARGVKVEKGILELITREVAIRCLPGLIPDSFKVDVTELGIGDSVHVSDLVAPEGVEILGETSAPIVIVSAPTAEVVAPTAEELLVEPTEPELIRPKREEDES